MLEQDGYLFQPHASAGRVPTDKGYRFFVDSLSGPAPLAAAQAELVRLFFARTHGELERMLAETSGLLSRLTDYAAVVVAPSAPEPGRVRSLQLVKLSTHLVLVVAVLGNGGGRATPARAAGRGFRRPGRQGWPRPPRCPWSVPPSTSPGR